MRNHSSLIVDGKNIVEMNVPKPIKLLRMVTSNVLKKYVGRIPDIFIISQSVDSDVL